MGIIARRTRLLPALLGMTVLTVACARSDFESDLRIRVVERSTLTTDGVATESVRPLEGAHVTVRAAGDVSAEPRIATTGHDGLVRLTNLEGFYDIAVDADNDQEADASKKRVKAGQTVEIVIQGPNRITDSTQNNENEEELVDLPPPTIQSVTINGGATETTNYAVVIDVEAEGAAYAGIAEQPTAPTARVPFQASFGYQLSFGQGFKTVYVWAINAEDEHAGPVSATIQVKTHTPYPPVLPLLYVLANRPGTDDYVGGLARSVEPGNLVTIYADTSYARKLTQGVARADGSFGPLNIGDGSVEGNVDAGDLVYVTNTDPFDRESAAVWIVNDSTPPLGGNLSGYWASLTPPTDIGTRNETFYAVYDSVSETRAADIAGGTLYFPPFSVVTPTAPIPANPALEHTVSYTIPGDLYLDAAGPITATVWDAAYNATQVKSLDGTDTQFYYLNSNPPDPVSLTTVKGGNRRLQVRWSDPNDDGRHFDLEITNHLGQIVYEKTISWMEYMCLTSEIRSHQVTDWHPNLTCQPDYPTLFIDWTIDGLANCYWYTVRVSITDMGLNRSPYSTPVSDLVIIPAPLVSAWGGLTDPSSGYGTVYYTLGIPIYTSRGELGISTSQGPPYVYAAPSGLSSPITFTSAPTGYKTPAVDGLEPGNDYYVSARVFDGTCASDYSPEITADTSLRVQAYVDGVTDARMGGAMAALATSETFPTTQIVAGAPGSRESAILDALGGETVNGLGRFFAPLDYNLPGTPIATLDLDGDGKDEVLVGSPLQDRNGFFLAGEVTLYSAGGATLATFSGDKEGLQYGYSVARLGDLNGDTVPEFAIAGIGCVHQDCLWSAAGPQEGPGRVDVYDGATRTVLRTHAGQPGDLLGASIASGFDVDGDGIEDYAIGAPAAAGHADRASVKIFSGDGNLTWSVPSPHSDARFGTSLTTATFDGVPTLFIGSVATNVFGRGYVETYVYEDSIWSPGWRYAGDSVGSGFGASLALADSISRDGTPDLIVGAPGQLQSLSYGAGGAYVLDAVTGNIRLEVRGADYDGGLGYAVLSLGDLEGASKTEWMASSPGSAHSGYESGRLYLFTTDR